MLEDHVKSSVTLRRLRIGPAAAHIDGFADWLHDRGYRPLSIDKISRSLAGWTDWLIHESFSESFVAGYEAYRTALSDGRRVDYQSGPDKCSLAAAAQFIRFLREQGVLAAGQQPLSPSERWPILKSFRSWTLQHRGVAHTTMANYEHRVADFIAACGAVPASYNAASVRSFIVTRSEGRRVATAQAIANAVRAFLRFLAATGQCSEGLLHAVPQFAHYQLASTPQFLEPEELERVIGACSDENAVGARDRAVILLLARLGLRAGDVAELTFTDIDWNNGRIAVCGKGRRQEWLPLPQQIGDAIIRYLRRGRPPLQVPQVFTSVLAPHRPMTRFAVTCCIPRQVVRKASFLLGLIHRRIGWEDGVMRADLGSPTGLSLVTGRQHAVGNGRNGRWVCAAAPAGYCGDYQSGVEKKARAANPRRAVAGATSIPNGAHRRAVR